MTIKMLCLSALAIALPSVAAFAASDTTALDNQEMMKPFYTDAQMTTLIPEADFKTVWMKMSKDDQDRIIKECSEQDLVKKHAEFCAVTRKFGEAK
jgi:hypothetical protein